MARVRLERAKRDAADERNRLCAIISGLKQENAKLREMVLEYAKIANYFCEREGYCSYDFVAQCKCYRPQQCRLGELNDKLNELGIEVDE